VDFSPHESRKKRNNNNNNKKKKTALHLSRNLVGRPGRNEEFSFAIYIYINK
jgi:hypothetical protein